MEKISLIIFDMDGLMFDTERIALQVWEKAGSDFGYKIEQPAVLEAIGADEKGTEKILKKYLGEEFPFHEVRKRRIEYFMQYIESHGIPVKDGLYELLEFLEQKSVFKAVATSTERERTERFLDLAGIKNKFDIIVCGDEVTRGKPDPEIYLTAAEKIGCTTDECIVLEDSEHGIMAAAGAGMLPVLIPDIKRPSKEVEKFLYREFESLSGVRDFLTTALK